MDLNPSQESFSSTLSADVLVIGAGISGLTAAYKLTQKDPSLRVLVLEAKDRVGGRTLTVPVKTSKGQIDQVDVGGSWIGESQKYIINLLEDLQLSTYEQCSQGLKVGQAGTTDLQTYDSNFPVFGSWYSRYELYQFIGEVERMAADVSLIDPPNSRFAQKLDGMTVETLIQNHLTTKCAQDIVTTFVRATFGVEPSQMSALFFVAFTRGTGGLFSEFRHSDCGARKLRVKGGAQKISEVLRDRIGASTVLLSDPVVQIKTDAWQVLVVTQSAKEYRADFAIVATPPSETARICFDPPLSLERRSLLQQSPAGHLSTFVVTYPKAFWRDKGFSGEVFSYGGPKVEHGCDVGPISVTFDTTTDQGSPALIGYLPSKTGMQWSNKDAKCRRQNILSSLGKIFGDAALKPVDFVEKNWANEPFVGGCPMHSVAPGIMYYFRHIRSPHGRVYFAGTETATQWYGYMCGAVEAGHRAAVEVLYELRPQVLTAADIEYLSHDWCHNADRPKGPPGVFRWTLWLPLALIALGWGLYWLRSSYCLIGTGHIA